MLIDAKSLSEEIKQDINEACERELADDPRYHLGASEIGKPCKRQLYYKFRWFGEEIFDGRMKRLFNRGHSEEARIDRWLAAAGFKVHSIDPATGKQYRFKAVDDHLGGSCDGVVELPEKYVTRYNLPEKFALLEKKTYNSKRFSSLLRDGVAKVAPDHVSQMNRYGKAFNLHLALYFAVNKNDDDIEPRVILLDWSEADAMDRKAEEIIYAPEPPPRIAENPAFFECKYCFAKGMCFHGEMPAKNCRSCVNSRPIPGAEWQCALFPQEPIPREVTLKGCPQWQPIKSP